MHDAAGEEVEPSCASGAGVAGTKYSQTCIGGSQLMIPDRR